MRSRWRSTDQHRLKFGDCLGTTGWVDGKGPDDGLVEVGRNSGKKSARRRQFILCNPVRSFRRYTAGDELIHGGCAGIDVRPGALFAVTVILFPGRVSRGEDCRHAAIAHSLPGCTEVQQNGSTGRRYVYVLRFDVAVKEPFGVDFLKSVQNRVYQIQRFFFHDTPAAVCQMVR